MNDPMTRRPLRDYLALQYPFQVLASRDGGYIIVFPDLPGCSTHAETVEEIPVMAEGARKLWIEGEYEDGHDIPLPSYPEEKSGKFNVRLPRSLHRALDEAARRNDASLNQYVEALLARGDAQDRVERRLSLLEAKLDQESGALAAMLDRRLAGLSGQLEQLGQRLRLADDQVHEGPARTVFISAQRLASHAKRERENDPFAEYAVVATSGGV